MGKKSSNFPDKMVRVSAIWNSRGTPWARAAVRLLLIIALAVFFDEGLIMLGLTILAPFSPWTKSLLDLLLLLIILAPLLYYFLFRPMVLEFEEHRKTGERVRHLNATLRAIRNVNQLITKSKDRDTLLQGACNLLVETQGFSNAGIALFDRSKGQKITYQAGENDTFEVLAEELRQGELPRCCREALERPGIIVTEDPSSQCNDCPLAERLEGSAGMTIRLEHAEKVYGVMIVSIPRQFIADREERALAEEVAGDIAFALHLMELEEERRGKEEALRISEKRYGTLVEESFDGIFVQKGPKVIFVNRRLREMLGYDEEELLGMDHWLLYHPEYQELTRERALARMRGEDTTTHYEVKMLRKDGSWFYAELGACVITVEGEPGIQVWIKDITERKKAEEERRSLAIQLRQAQKMEAIGTLAGGIAHDFNNILGAIIGMSELALLEVQEGTSLHRHIDQVLKAGMRAKELVQQILAFSRQTDEGFLTLSITPIVKETLKFLKSSLPSTIDVKQYVEKDPGLINGNPTQIHQILMNLCTNAEHAMREQGGVLEVEVRKVEMTTAKGVLTTQPTLHPGPYVCVSVSDTGHGMAPEVIEHIFEPYFTTKDVGEGTGLGLAVTHGIVHKHGGGISVESEVGKGTTFRVYFPVMEGEEKVKDEAETPLPTGTERILFVDDEVALTEVGKGMLEQLGYEVTVRTSSLEALELFKARPEYFDLVITDMSMPNMTGEQLSLELMKIRPDIPIILCTGFSHIISEKKAGRIGIKAFAMKPLVRKDLAETVRKALDG